MPRDPQRPNRIRLNSRDRKILRHVARFRMTTIDVLQHVVFRGKKRDAVKSTLRRLCGRPPRYRYLRPEPLDGRRVYFRLTNRAAEHLGLGKHLARPLGVQARAERYAMLWFLCVEDSADRLPFSLRDFPEHFDLQGHRLPRSRFYLEEQSSGETRLGYAVIDRGRHPRRLIRNTGETLERFLRQGWLDGFISTGRFDLAVLTISQEKQRALQLGLEKQLRKRLESELTRFGFRRDEPFPIPRRFFIVPGLIDLLPDA